MYTSYIFAKLISNLVFLIVVKIISLLLENKAVSLEPSGWGHKHGFE